MNSFTGIIIMILFIILFKSAINLFDKFATYKDNKLKFTIDIKRESINKMSNLEFESFCRWLFEGDAKYSDVTSSPLCDEDNIDLILTSENNEKALVQCTKDGIDTSTCKKLIGAMVAHNIYAGIILSTGAINNNIYEYIQHLRDSSQLEINIMTMSDIITILDERVENDTYSIDIIL